MNKTAIKRVAVCARAGLTEAVRKRTEEYAITEKNLKIPNDRNLSETEKKQLADLIRQIEKKGYSAVIEDTADELFCRIIMLRFMESNGFLENKIFENEEIFRKRFIKSWSQLSEKMPFIFKKAESWQELLIPDGLFLKDAVIGSMLWEIPEEDWHDSVQIIGWLYQYYNTELKNEAFALLRKNIKISKERLPAATQIFTPDWIVRYMVENSLGRLWLSANPDDSLKENWKYYIDDSEQEKYKTKISPEEIKFIDPCAGSGQILVYVFEVLMQIYKSCGYSESDAAKSILRNNLFGLDIDSRASTLACFSVMMKARKYDSKIFESGIKPNIISFTDTSFMDDEFISFFAEGNADMKCDMAALKAAFADAKEKGSLLYWEEKGTEAIKERACRIVADAPDDVLCKKAQKTENTAKQAKILSQKYHAVVTNPPYMRAGSMSQNLCEFVKKNYPDSKHDLYAAFMERCLQMLREDGYLAMLTQHSWMFLSGYEKLRKKLLEKRIINMLHLGAKAFEEIGGEVVQTAGFVLQNSETEQYKGTYCRLTEPTAPKEKEELFLSGEGRFVCSASDFSRIPGSPIAYWVSGSIIEKFEKCPKLSDVGTTKLGMTTGENARFVRYWYEVNIKLCEFDVSSQAELDTKTGYWVPYNKGGAFRKWYGNNDCVLYWKNRGEAIKSFADEKGRIRSTVPNTEYYFLPCASWSKISTGRIAFRYKRSSIFDVAGACYFSEKYDLNYMMGLLNSSVVDVIIGALSPTLNYEGGQISTLPVMYDEEKKNFVCGIVAENIKLSKDDWDSFETSWDFKRHPLI